MPKVILFLLSIPFLLFFFTSWHFDTTYLLRLLYKNTALKFGISRLLVIIIGAYQNQCRIFYFPLWTESVFAFLAEVLYMHIYIFNN